MKKGVAKRGLAVGRTPIPPEPGNYLFYSGRRQSGEHERRYSSPSSFLAVATSALRIHALCFDCEALIARSTNCSSAGVNLAPSVLPRAFDFETFGRPFPLILGMMDYLLTNNFF